MEALSLVLMSVVLLSHSLIILSQDLKNPLLCRFIRRDCELIGLQTNWNNAYISLNPFHPNSICIIRLVLAGTAIFSFYSGNYFDWVIIYLISAFGDAVDGMVARDCKLETEFGKKFDPLCDKLTYLPFMMIFAYQGYFSEIAVWALIIFIIVEVLGQFVVRRILDKKGKSTAANSYGKIKAAIAFAIPPYVFVVRNGDLIPDLSSGLVIVCAVLAIMSAVSKILPQK